MSNCRYDLIADLEFILTSQHDSSVVVRNCCTYVSRFLNYLAQRDIPIADVIEAHMAQYLRHAIALFQKHRGRLPSTRWGEVPRSEIHALLRLARLDTL